MSVADTRKEARAGWRGRRRGITYGCESRPGPLRGTSPSQAGTFVPSSSPGFGGLCPIYPVALLMARPPQPLEAHRKRSVSPCRLPGDRTQDSLSEPQREERWIFSSHVWLFDVALCSPYLKGQRHGHLGTVGGRDTGPNARRPAFRRTLHAHMHASRRVLSPVLGTTRSPAPGAVSAGPGLSAAV